MDLATVAARSQGRGARGRPNLDPDQNRHLRSGLFTGWEIAEDLQAALTEFTELAESLRGVGAHVKP